ncbi:MAG: hypothetical protein AAFN12_16495 [Cyanobacteria bacterium J06560_2]
MKHVRNTFSALLNAIRPLAIAAACALVVFSSATPALAFGGSDSKPSKGLEQLDTVQSKSENAISSRSAENDTRAVMENSQKGLNGVQGRANKGDMISPSDANATSVETNIKEALEDITNK